MQLAIDPRYGISGDIACAGLIGLGGDADKITGAMEYAGGRIGTMKVTSRYYDGAVRLDICLKKEGKHLHESEAKAILENTFEHIPLETAYQTIAKNALAVLCDAERYVHGNDPRLHHMIHHHQHGGDTPTEAVLHEASDIVADVAGFAAGLQELKITDVVYLDYVNAGNGTITFSHGTLDVPAPATEHILNSHDIPWQKSLEHYNEMATPTGVSLLAGCRAKRTTDVNGLEVIKESMAAGTIKGLPPVPFYLVE
ncbi:MAG: DUF111 family protein [Candidatus Aenigmarchaeota archaeon]|nr:DUF111 family protein [Candidatus Aenigmarchaeota archaeon]